MNVSVPADAEVGFEADGRRWRLHMGINALIRLEREVQEPEQIERLFGHAEGAASLETVTWAVWAGLQDHHPELTIDDAGNLVEHYGLEAMGVKVAEAIILAFPTRKGGEPRPRKAARPKRGRG